jgi:hypothetical protein
MNNKFSKIKEFEKRISKRFINAIDLYDTALHKNNYKEKEGK